MPRSRDRRHQLVDSKYLAEDEADGSAAGLLDLLRGEATNVERGGGVIDNQNMKPGARPPPSRIGGRGRGHERGIQAPPDVDQKCAARLGKKTAEAGTVRHLTTLGDT